MKIKAKKNLKASNQNGHFQKVQNNGDVKKEVEEPKVESNKSKKRILKKELKNEGILVKHNEGDMWYSIQVDKHVDEESKLSATEIDKFLAEGRDILTKDAELLQQKDKQEGGSEASWLYSVISKGTASDRKTAMQLQMHKSPIHSLEYIEKLLAAVRKPGTRDVIDTIPILEDIFINHLLPSDRKLVTISNRPLADLTKLSSGNDRTRRKILLLWTFEHEVKLMYQRFLQTISEIVSRPMEESSKRALRCLANCLIEKPEAENLALSSLVNAFGHPNYKIGAHLVHLFEDITRRHPAMRVVIVNEIERLIFRKNVNERAHLYSVTFLSQMKFTSDDCDLACQLLRIYLALFKTLVEKKVNDSRLLPILLSGANRAFPYAKGVETLLDDMQGIYYLAHNSSYRTSIPALRLLFQFHKLSDYVSDRYYGALYRKLLDQCPPSAYAQLLKLVFDTLKSDASANRVRTFVKRLLQLAVNESAEFAASVLILISKLKKEREGENLLVLSKNADKSVNLGNDDDDDEEEVYVDVDVDGNKIVKKEEEVDEDDVEIDEKKKIVRGKLGPASKAGWVHRDNNRAKASKSVYDSSARNPLFIDSSQVADNELLLLSKHYHPSVAVFAKCLLEGGEVNYGGDALTDFALMGFLDRFAFRNPKDEKKSNTAVRVVRKKAHDPWGVRRLAVDSKEYTSKKRDEIPADERFLHRYASSVLRKDVKKEAENEDEWEHGSVNSEEFEAILDRFEPGELNEEFDIDYSKEFSSEKKRKGEKRKATEDDVDMDEEDDFEDDDDEMDDEEGDEEPEDDDEDDEDVEMESDGDDEGNMANVFGKAGRGDAEESSDEEMGENDYELAGDKFAAMLEDIEDEDLNKKKRMKHKTRKPKGYKKLKRK